MRQQSQKTPESSTFAGVEVNNSSIPNESKASKWEKAVQKKQLEDMVGKETKIDKWQLYNERQLKEESRVGK